MKISFLTISLLFFSLSCSGQFAEKIFTIGGQGTFQHYRTYPDEPTYQMRVFSFSISPEIGYFVIDNLMIGTLISYERETRKPAPENIYLTKFTQHTFGAGLLTRYYYKYFFGEARYELKRERSFFGKNFDESKFVSRNLSVSIGRTFLLGKEIAIEPKLSYVIPYYKSEGYFGSSTSDNDSNVLLLSISTRAYIGFRKSDDK